MENVKIYASIIDEITRQQIEELAQSDAYNGCRIRVMPDCHAGKGCTIGSVIEFKDRIVCNTVGVDIGCGMLVAELGKVDIDYARLDEIINRCVPSGFNVHDKPVCTFDEMKDFIADIHDKEYLQCSIGTLGGGNHFIEMDVDDEDNKYLVIHSGSRNLGVQVCEYWQNKAIENLTDDSKVRNELIDRLKAEGRQKEIKDELEKIKKPVIKKNLAYLEGKDMECYLHDMKLCQSYANLNRNVIVTLILEELGISEYKVFTTIHNYVDLSHNIIRKGAISAQKDEKVLIPINMRDGSLICIGKGNPDWLCSAPHGAGRIMSRAQARENLKMADYQDTMRGIYSTSVCESTIDEAPMAYKPLEAIIRDIEPTVEISRTIRPVYNFKAK